MAIAKLKDEVLEETVKLYDTFPTIPLAARAAGVSPSTFKHRLHRAAERGFMGTAPVLPGFSIRQISEKVDGAWVKQTREHGEVFETPTGHVIKGVSALVDADGHTIQQWVKTKAEDPTADLVSALRLVFDAYKGKAEEIEAPADRDEDLMSVYPIADQHLGMLSWGRETGEDYDLEIGAARLRVAMAKLVSQSPPSRAALILNLGDWTHTDDQTNSTPRGNNQLDVDSRYCKILTAGVRLMMDCIELALQKHETVTVRNLPGNHDPHASIALTVALSAFYSNNPRVTIDDSPSEFFFTEFGATLIGANHGHRCKPPVLAMAMAVNNREAWGRTKYHWMLTGHIHHERAHEVGDVRCESFQTLAAKDAYAAGHGFSSGQSLTSVTLHKEDGEVGRHRVNIPPPR